MGTLPIVRPPGGEVRAAVRVLVTGFEPFAGAARNSSWEAVSALAHHATPDGAARLEIACLPVVFGGLRSRLAALLEQHQPDVVIATGLAAGRPTVTVERIAINLAHARIPDNAGMRPAELRLVPNGPAGRWSTLPVPAILAAAARAGVRLTDSLSAGAFVCNAAMYHLLDLTAGTGTLAGFVHVPATSVDAFASHEVVDEKAVPLVALQEVVDALGCVIDSCVANVLATGARSCS